MVDIIVQASECVTLVGAGPVNKADLKEALDLAPCLVAADGGAELLLNYGETPKKVIGDFDSIDREFLEKIPVSDRHHVAEQESTDFEKCLTRIRAPLILGLGFLGARLDHQLAAMNALVRNPGGPCLLIGDEDIVFHAPGELSLTLETDSRISLIPLRPVRGHSEGLHWPIKGLDFSPPGQIGISNRAIGGNVRLSFDGPGMLVILPRAALAEAVRALLAGVRAR